MQIHNLKDYCNEYCWLEWNIGTFIHAQRTTLCCEVQRGRLCDAILQYHSLQLKYKDFTKCYWIHQIALAAMLPIHLWSVRNKLHLDTDTSYLSSTLTDKCWNYSLQNVNSSSGTVISVLYASVFYCKFPICSMWKSLQCSRLLFGQTWYSYTIKGKLKVHSSTSTRKTTFFNKGKNTL